MISVVFVGGFADGVELQLARAPDLLRAVEDGGTWDALDQLDDEPKYWETIVVYRRGRTLMSGFIDFRGKGGGRRGERFTRLEYIALADQPADEEVRSTAAWRSWCLRNRERIGV